MYNIYVTNKSDVNVFVRLHRQQISSLNENFHRELDKLTARDGPRSPRSDGNNSQTRSTVSSFLARWGFCNIPKRATMPFVAEDVADCTRMYASLYSQSRLWLMDYEVHSSKYGCVFVNQHVKSHHVQDWPLNLGDLRSLGSHSQSLVPVYLSQINPEPQWITKKKGDCVDTGQFIGTGIGGAYFGHSSFGGGTTCKVTSLRDDQNLVKFDTWEAVNGNQEEVGELLKDTGHEFVRAKSGDYMPPHAVMVGVSDTDGPLYLGRVRGNTPCSITTDDDRVKYFCYYSGYQKEVERGEIMVLTGHG